MEDFEQGFEFHRDQTHEVDINARSMDVAVVALGALTTELVVAVASTPFLDTSSETYGTLSTAYTFLLFGTAFTAAAAVLKNSLHRPARPIYLDGKQPPTSESE